MRLKRAILLASTALLAGAVVNVGVAWLLAVRFTSGVRSSPSPSAYRWPSSAPEDWPQPTGFYTEIGAGVTMQCAQYSRESAYFRRYCDMMPVECGWPARSVVRVRGERFLNVKVPDPSYGGTRFQTLWAEQLRGAGTGVYGLPIRPLWPGFALNTLFYATILSAPFVLFAGVRRWRRRAHYQCPKCAYDLRGLAPAAPCPECGAITPKAS